MVFNIKLTAAAKMLLHLIYPPLCVHCQGVLKQRLPRFCQTCLEQIALMEVTDRCRTCFAELYKGKCQRCKQRSVVIQRQLAACECLGPARSLANSLQKGQWEYLSAAASLMAYQWLEQKFHLPDFLIPLPGSLGQKLKSGFDVNEQLTKELSKILAIPTCLALQRKFDHELFLTQGECRFRFEGIKKQMEVLSDQRALLIALHLEDDILRQAGSELKSCFPAQLDALCFVYSDLKY